MESKERLIIGVLLEELRKTKKSLITVGGISSEKTVQHYLNGIFKNIDELIKATEKEIGGKINDTNRKNETTNGKNEWESSCKG